MKIYLLLAHPDSDSFNGRIADAYEKAAREKGHEVRYQKLGELTFDPILRKGFRADQSLEPDLKAAQENILWCDRWVIVYPLWWGSLPAILRGFFDRALLPGFAFKYHQNDPMWDKLLKGRTAELITTFDSPSWWIRFQYGNSDLNTIKPATLGFCGIKTTRVTRIPRVRYLDAATREKHIQKITAGIPSA